MPSADQVPVITPHSTMRWHIWVVLIAGSTGSALRAVRPPNLHITPVIGAISVTWRARRVPCSAHPLPSWATNIKSSRGLFVLCWRRMGSSAADGCRRECRKTSASVECNCIEPQHERVSPTDTKVPICDRNMAHCPSGVPELICCQPR
jgi:hypothetical protein